MTQRTRDKTWAFRNPFSLKGVDRPLPSGNYRVTTDEELIESLSFPVYRLRSFEHSLLQILILSRRPAQVASAKQVHVQVKDRLA